MTVLMVIIGAGVGAPARFLIDRAIQARHRTPFPWGTFTVNMIACVVLGLSSGALTAGASSATVQALVGTGFCGALSTYSTFSYESFRLYEEESRFFAVANVLASLLAGLGAVLVGGAVAQAIWA